MYYWVWGLLLLNGNVATVTVTYTSPFPPSFSHCLLFRIIPGIAVHSHLITLHASSRRTPECIHHTLQLIIFLIAHTLAHSCTQNAHRRAPCGHLVLEMKYIVLVIKWTGVVELTQDSQWSCCCYCSCLCFEINYTAGCTLHYCTPEANLMESRHKMSRN